MKKTIEYQIGEDILKIIEKTLYESMVGNIDFLGPDPSVEKTIETGIGGLKYINEAIQKMAVRSGLVINASGVGSLITTGEDRGIVYTKYTIPFLANIRFVINPTYDSIDPDGIYINGFRQKSYNYTIIEEDISIIAIGCLPRTLAKEHISSELEKLRAQLRELTQYIQENI